MLSRFAWSCFSSATCVDCWLNSLGSFFPLWLLSVSEEFLIGCLKTCQNQTNYLLITLLSQSQPIIETKPRWLPDYFRHLIENRSSSIENSSTEYATKQTISLQTKINFHRVLINQTILLRTQEEVNPSWMQLKKTPLSLEHLKLASKNILKASSISGFCLSLKEGRYRSTSTRSTWNRVTSARTTSSRSEKLPF